MSWETFKQNILRVANNPEGIADIETVADLYAKEYDAAIKRGRDIVHGTKVQSGDVEGMKRIFISALRKGLTSTNPYDLVGEMGEGVLTYWRFAVLGNEVVPKIPASTSIQNISVNSNNATNAGKWQKPTGNSDLGDFQLTPVERLEYLKELEQAEIKKQKAIAESDVIKEGTYRELINKLENILIEDEEYGKTVPPPSIPEIESMLGAKSGTVFTNETIQVPPEKLKETEDETPPAGLSGGELEVWQLQQADKKRRASSQDTPVVNTGDKVEKVAWSTGKPFVSGFKAGGGGGIITGGGGFYGPPNFPPNASLGQRILAIALRDAAIQPPVKESPTGSDWGHPRIIDIHKNCGFTSGAAWCAMTVSMWFDEAGAGIKSSKNPNKFAGFEDKSWSRSWVGHWFEWAGLQGRLIDLRNGGHDQVTPQAGWPIIYNWPGGKFDFDHIGIFWKQEGSTWYGVDGNGGVGLIRTHTVSKKCVVGLIIV